MSDGTDWTHEFRVAIATLIEDARRRGATDDEILESLLAELHVRRVLKGMEERGATQDEILKWLSNPESRRLRGV
jgi:hypothetical protein